MAQRNNNNGRSNRGRYSNASNGNNCSCSYRLMYIMARNPTVSRNHLNNTSNASSNTSRRTRSGNQRQLEGTNPGTIPTRHRLSASARVRNNPIQANFFLRITDESNGPRIEIRTLQNQSTSNAPERVHSGRRRSRNTDYTIYPFNQDVHLPWPNMNSVHNYHQPNTPRAPIYTNENSSNNGNRTRSRPSRLRVYSSNSVGEFSPSIVNSLQQGFVPRRSGSTSSMESDQMSRESDYSNNSDLSTNVFPLNGREECLVCLSNLSEYVLVNCRHLCLCGDCVTHFRRQRHCDDDTPSTRCPVCRTPILSNPRRHNLN